jgi:hypothetical protein
MLMAQPQPLKPVNPAWFSTAARHILPYMSSYEDEEDEDDAEAPDESDMDEHDEPDLLPCPNCRRMITEDIEQCPYCREWITHASGIQRSRWTIIIVALIILSMLGFAIVWLLGR